MISGRQRALAEALLRKSDKAGEAVGMYLEALRAIERDDSIEALHVAAYELREFMNVLPKVLDLPVANYQQQREKVMALVKEWEAKSSSSKNFDGKDWNGEIDRHLSRLLAHLGTFVEWWREYVPARKHQFKDVLRRLIPLSRPMPESLLTRRTDQWSELLAYFQKVTHHNTRPDRADFLSQVESLEEFLMEHLEPRTFEDQDEIDQIISDVEGPRDS